MPWAGFEPATPTPQRPQTYTLDSGANGIGRHLTLVQLKQDVEYNVDTYV
jgi:hypothetical protein